MRAKDYVEASYELLVRGTSPVTVLKNLRVILERKGLLAMYGKILRALLDKMVRRHSTEGTCVTVAREGDGTRNAKDIQNAISDIGGDTAYQTKIDPHLIGGFIVTHSGRRVDKSYKSTLLHVYQNIAK